MLLEAVICERVTGTQRTQTQPASGILLAQTGTDTEVLEKVKGMKSISNQTDSKQTDSNQTDSNQTDSKQTDSNQTDSNQKHSNQTDQGLTPWALGDPEVPARSSALMQKFCCCCRWGGGVLVGEFCWGSSGGGVPVGEFRWGSSGGGVLVAVRQLRRTASQAVTWQIRILFFCAVS